MLKRVLFLAALLFLMGSKAGAQIINASDCNSGSVQTALNSVVSDGTTVIIPSGSCTWTTTVSYTASFTVTVLGQTTVSGTCAPGGSCTPSDNTTVTNSTGSAALHITSVNGKSLRVSGLTFAQGTGAQQFVGNLFIDGGSQSVRVDHNHFLHANIVDLTIQSNSTAGNIYGVVDHNMFNTGGSNEDAMRVEHYNWNGSANMVGYGQGGGEGSWTDSAHFGSNQFVFIENNTFAFDGANTTHAFAFDIDAGGGRVVFRFNNVTPNMALQTHGTGSGDPNFRGSRALEIYGNNFAYVSTTNTFQAFEWETGSVMAWNNTWSNYTQVFQLDYVRSTNATYSQSATPNGWGYCSTSPIGGVAGPSTWDVSGSGPCVDQVGRGAGDLVHGTFPSKVDTVSNTITWPNQAAEPSYLWGNTLTSVNHYVVHFASGSINENTDYFTERPNIDNSATFNGTAGIGCGPAAGAGCSNPVTQPSTCTQGVGYWNPATSTLSVCNGSNTFVASYTPYTYPHPLTQVSTGWKFLQDSPLIFCQGSGRTSCSPGLGNIVPTVAGSVWILQSQSPNNVTISSVTGGGGTWIHCTACHVTNPSGLTADAWYNLTGTAGFNGANPFSFTLSGSAGTFFGANFVELLPPAGSTASFDSAGTATPTGCTTCTAASPGTLTGTDAIWINPGGGPNATWKSWSAPYITDSNGSGVCLNCSSGTAPSQTFGSSNQNPEFMALAFKSSLGMFTPQTKQYSVANFTAVVPTSACTTCTITIPSTTAGNLLYVQTANEIGSFMSAISGAGSGWVIPTSCQAKLTIQGQNNAMSCAYNLSVTGGATSLSITMGGNGSHGFAVAEFSSSAGPFTVDTIGATLNTPNATCSGYCFPGQPFTLTGSNDVAIQAAWIVGQNPTGPNYYAQPTIPTTSQGAQGPGSFNAFFAQNASIALLTDTGASPPTPTWINAVANQNSFVTGAAFTTTSSGTPAVSLSPTSITFANQAATTTSSPQTVTLTNTGGASLTISSITITGVNSSDFAISTNTCGAALGINASCSVSVTFTPAALGSRSGALTFTTNAPSSPDNASLSGFGALAGFVTGTGTISGTGVVHN